MYARTYFGQFLLHKFGHKKTLCVFIGLQRRGCTHLTLAQALAKCLKQNLDNELQLCTAHNYWKFCMKITGEKLEKTLLF